jgi:hypothetical protein
MAFESSGTSFTLDGSLNGVAELFGEFAGATLDIGGSTTKCAIADGAANLLRCFSFPTAASTLTAVLAWMSESGRQLVGVTGGGAKLYAALLEASPSCSSECVTVGEMDSIGAGVAALQLVPALAESESSDEEGGMGDLIVAMIGSGTSIVRVAHSDAHDRTAARRITGTPFGGATFRGLASLLARGESDPSALVAMASSVPERGRAPRVPCDDPSYNAQLWTTSGTAEDLAPIDAIYPWDWRTVHDRLEGTGDTEGRRKAAVFVHRDTGERVDSEEGERASEVAWAIHRAKLAARGTLEQGCTALDLTVGDIYGASLAELGLPANVMAASFGRAHLGARELAAAESSARVETADAHEEGEGGGTRYEYPYDVEVARKGEFYLPLYFTRFMLTI